MRADTLATEAALGAFLDAFYACTLPKEEFSHAGHLTVAAGALYGSKASEALPVIRQSIRRFNEAVGGSNTESAGYHETLTIFWLRVVEQYFAEVQPDSRLEAAQQAVARFGPLSRLYMEYYSWDVVADQLARRKWREPDLRPL